jgi:hypothetical protein
MTSGKTGGEWWRDRRSELLALAKSRPHFLALRRSEHRSPGRSASRPSLAPPLRDFKVEVLPIEQRLPRSLDLFPENHELSAQRSARFVDRRLTVDRFSGHVVRVLGEMSHRGKIIPSSAPAHPLALHQWASVGDGLSVPRYGRLESDSRWPGTATERTGTMTERTGAFAERTGLVTAGTVRGMSDSAALPSVPSAVPCAS